MTRQIHHAGNPRPHFCKENYETSNLGSRRNGLQKSRDPHRSTESHRVILSVGKNGWPNHIGRVGGEPVRDVRIGTVQNV